MGPRKSTAGAIGKDDGVAMGKMRRVHTSGGSTSGSAGSSLSPGRHQGHPSNTNDASPLELPYTSEERAFLNAQLALFSATSSNGGSSSGNPLGASGNVDFAAMTKEHWLSGLPLLVSATEKLLQIAAVQYQATCKSRAASAAAARAAAPSGDGTNPLPSSPSGTQPGGNLLSPDSSKHVIHASLEDNEDGLLLNNGDVGTQGLRPTPAAGTAPQFLEENAYIVAQAQQLLWYPFTYQRWVELLLDPGRYHISKDTGRLRGDAIQASLRRCILVTCPIVDGGDCL